MSAPGERGETARTYGRKAGDRDFVDAEAADHSHVKVLEAKAEDRIRKGLADAAERVQS